MISKNIIIIPAIIIILLIVVYSIGKIRTSFLLKKEVTKLFAKQNTVSEKHYSVIQLEGLPAPVQRYFGYALKDGQPYINSATIKHTGYFKTDLKKDWIKITGKEYFTTNEPGFIWEGSTAMFTARDQYLSGKGNLVVKVLSLYTVIDGKGPEFDQGELLRWLGEATWFPTALLPSDNLHWTAIDDDNARLSLVSNGLNLSYLVTFNAAGAIVRMETKRYMGTDGLETWVIKLADYKKINEVMVPVNVEAIWQIRNTEYSYAKFHLTTLEYDNPSGFN